MKTKSAKWKPCPLEAYGYVVVMAGKHKGRCGYYDDDDSQNTAIVYFDITSENFMRYGYYLILRKYLASIHFL